MNPIATSYASQRGQSGLLMAERGLERGRLFSWKKSVAQHLEIYRRLA